MGERVQWAAGACEGVDGRMRVENSARAMNGDAAGRVQSDAREGRNG